MEGRAFYIRLGEKLKKARKSVGMTQQEVAEKIGFDNYQTLLSIEKGERSIKTWELLNLAKIYNYDINYFLSDNWYQYETQKVFWRSSSKSPQRQVLENKFITYCQRYHLLEQRINPDFKPVFKKLNKEERKGFDYSRAENLATEYWEKLDLGSRPALIIYKILEENLGIKILFLNLGEHASGAATIGSFGPAILINSSEAPWRRNFDLAHEFFHLLTWDLFDLNEVHCDIDEQNKSREDKFADCFASAILLPKDSLIKVFEKNIKDESLSYEDSIMIAKEFGVSIDALLWRLVNLKRINPASAQKALENTQLRALNKQLRLLESSKEPYFSDRYISLAFYCYKKGFISRAKLAEYFDIELAELSDFLFNEGYAEEGDYEIKISP